MSDMARRHDANDDTDAPTSRLYPGAEPYDPEVHDFNAEWFEVFDSVSVVIIKA
jgi:hypothetical protein